MRNVWFLLLVWLVVLSCTDEKKPSALLPDVAVYEAKDITRTSAVLSGNVRSQSGVIVSSCHFVYASVNIPDIETRIAVGSSEGAVEVTLSELIPGTTYIYYLEVSNEISRVASEPLQFTTNPYTPPLIAETTLVGQGPISVTLQCSVLDDGGMPVEVGFRFVESLTGEAEEVAGEMLNDGVFSVKKNNLKQECAYLVSAYADNKEGKVYSNEIAFETSNSAYIAVPGTLNEQIEGEAKYTLTTLTVSGVLNGTDVRLLRELLGRDVFGEATPGQLKQLNLYDATIVEGGLNYSESRYTEENVLGTAMFKDCILLEELILPHTLVKIEKDAWEGCTRLTSIHFPSDVTEFTPSGGCTALREFTVSPLNTVFSSIDGVLYSKDGSKLLYYPEGRTATSFSIPSTVKIIGEYAFRHSPATEVLIPHSVETLEMHAFYGSQIEKIVISDAVTVIPYAAFQSCNRLTHVTLGTSTELLSDYCFDGCPLEDIYTLADYPPVVRSTAFASAQVFQQCIIHVLPGCRNLYRLSNSWKSFQRFVEDAVAN